MIKTELDGLLIIKPKVFNDDRGYFFESYNENTYRNAGIDYFFLQDNISKSIKGTVRGLHYQIGENAQGKLCKVIYGKVLDVAVDIRFGSPTFGKYFSSELSEENHTQLWIPPGFAHGFSVLSDEAIFSYKCTKLYSKPNERAIRYNDPDLNINWKVKNPIVSEKDLIAPLLKNINKDFTF
ncbi:MAG TPA: dTDP-4-dehydrorhamnose 3,5-epimerase [Ignavibacteriaceae bacterium]|nr:dTDP-4-dehydrorhamnose 3,5-epimerase [Ignavibacteriaceae bacterium]HRN26013.1 dTDP-4-dehydrorhamnose 3,5-epimerase [Ignavibacteriaceae bacterium]HRP91343.1 dTDP-4-dehydrorhamnose 3,5-epimerase [Ignavibacteriaceae bacterium]HRQ53633.1 dTDP-4-dehydrorhamnose 3,5-epimerase [Ignavibacteriaceae bacterium]